jgi:predicted lactoylglutathione lyase
MMSKMIFVNLPVRDLAASTAFYVALGGTVNPQFSGENSSALMFSDSIGVMLLTYDHYRMFTQRPIGDARRESQALIALSAESREAVNETLKTLTAMSGRSCGWIRQRLPGCPGARDRSRVTSPNSPVQSRGFGQGTPPIS